MKRIIFFSVFLSLCVENALAQQEVMFTQYYQNAFYYNPAAGGLTKTTQLDMGYRNQWSGMEGAPQSFFFTGHSEVRFNSRGNEVIEEFNVDKENVFETPKNRIGGSKHVMGGRLLSDAIGPFQKQSVLATYAYHLRFTKKTMLGLGVAAGWSNYGLNQSKVVLLDEDDAEYNQFLTRNSNQNIFDINAGLTLYGERFSFGIASTQLLDNEMVIDQVVTESSYGRHWSAFGMYQFDINTVFTLEPHFMIQTIGNAPVSLNLGSRVIYSQRYWANLGFRFGDALNFGFGMNVARNFRFGYAYDFGVGRLQGVTQNVHELQIGYIIGNNRKIDKELEEGKIE